MNSANISSKRLASTSLLNRRMFETLETAWANWRIAGYSDSIGASRKGAVFFLHAILRQNPMEDPFLVGCIEPDRFRCELECFP